MATDLVRRRVNVIAAISPYAALAAQAATKTIPDVFQSGSDSIEAGVVANLSRSRGSLTGFYRFAHRRSGVSAGAEINAE
jgi:ABC-type uncharacterized transport system substrate-binding protein